MTSSKSNIISFLLFLIITAGNVLALEYSVEGTYEIVPSRNIEIPMKLKGTFHLDVSNHLWSISSVQQEDTSYDETSYDGDLIYTYINFSQSQETSRAKGLSVSSNSGQAVIIKGPFPATDNEITRILWLIYCSSQYFSTINDAKLHPIAFDGSRNLELLDVKQDARWHLNATTGLPDFVGYQHDGIFRTWNDEQVGVSPPTETKWHKPYGSGFTNSIMLINEYQQLGSLQLPVKAKWMVLSPKGPGIGSSSNDLSVSRTVLITANNLSALRQDAHFIPVVQGITIASDLRFSDATNRGLDVNYTFTNHWLSDEQVKNMPQFRGALRSLAKLKKFADREPPRWSKAAVLQLVFTVIAVIVVTTILIMWLVPYFRKKQSH